MCVSAPGDEVSLITLKLEVTIDMSLRALVDCGASNNFVRRQSLEAGSFNFVEREITPTKMTVRLATGASITVKKRVVGIHYTLKDEQYDDDFIVLDLDDKLDVILGLPWLRKYEPRVSWQCRSVTIPATSSSANNLTNILERPHSRGCTTSECDGLTHGTFVSTAVQEHNVDDHNLVEKDLSDPVEVIS